MTELTDQPAPNVPTRSARLGSTLFIMALAHGVIILGITFTPGSIDESSSSTTLKVSLVTGPADLRPEEASFIANQDQLGSGDQPDTDRPTTSISTADLMTISGDQRGVDMRDAVAVDSATPADRLITSGPSDRQINVDPNAPEETAPQPQRSADRLAIQSQQTLAAEVDIDANAPENDSEAQLGPSARQSILAEYLDTWRGHVERIGTLNFPDQFLANHSATARPILEVAIGADGSLRDIVIASSSGDSAVDQAAISILRLAAPFDSLPPIIAAEYGELRFAYEWDFIAEAR